MEFQINAPVLKQEDLDKAAYEAAEKGAKEEIKEYYSGYRSPFREQFRKELEAQNLNIHFGLPEVISVLNEQMCKIVDELVNVSIAQSYVSEFREFFGGYGIEKEMKLSELMQILKGRSFAESLSFEVEKDDHYDWYYLNIKLDKKSYSITLHKDIDSKDGIRYQALSLPYKKGGGLLPEMILECDFDGLGRGSIKMPFTRGVLSDPMESFFARVIMVQTSIELDVMDSDDCFHDEY